MEYTVQTREDGAPLIYLPSGLVEVVDRRRLVKHGTSSRVGRARRVIIHTSGRRIADSRCKSFEARRGRRPTPDEIDSAVSDFYVGNTFRGHALAGSEKLYLHADPTTVVSHSGALSVAYASRYGLMHWRKFAKPVGGRLVPHGRPGDVVYDYWLARWGEHIASPAQFPGAQQSINRTSVGFDVRPLLAHESPDGALYSQRAYEISAGYTAWALQHQGIRCGRETVHGHCDADPVSRGTVKDGNVIRGVDWDPGKFDWAFFYSILAKFMQVDAIGW